MSALWGRVKKCCRRQRSAAAATRTAADGGQTEAPAPISLLLNRTTTTSELLDETVRALAAVRLCIAPRLGKKAPLQHRAPSTTS